MAVLAKKKIIIKLIIKRSSVGLKNQWTPIIDNVTTYSLPFRKDSKFVEMHFDGISR